MAVAGWALAALLAGALVPPPLFASERKAKSLYAESRRAELDRDYERALSLAEQARREDPRDHRYELAARRIRFLAAQTFVDQGRRLRDEGLLPEAVEAFQRAVEMDPASTVAAQQLRRTLDLIEKRQGATPSADGEPPLASALDIDRSQRESMVDSLKEPPLLRAISNQPIDLLMSEQSKVVFETIGKLAGINVLFDSDYTDKRIDVEIRGATLSEALDYVSLIAKTYWKPIAANAIFVTQDNANKRREYEEEIVKTVYLNNVATPQELQEIVTAVRGLTDIRRLFPVTSMNALIMRGTEARLALAEKVIHDIDKARPEVIIDVLVLEASRSRTRELGLTPVSAGVNGIGLPATFNREGGVRLGDVRGVGGNDWVTTLPSAQLTALFSSSDTNLLQSPRLRASDNMQASLRIGDKIPIATGSFQPGVGGVGINPLVNTQFTFTDVGVNVDIQPKVHNDREVSMHVEIEISNVRDFVDLGGISQPVIGQRAISHDIRLVEGEASILGGLNQSQVFKTRSGVPFLAEIPILGRLFSITKVDEAENEILIVLIPHLVRLPTIEDSNLKAVASGTDQIFTVRFKEQATESSALPPVGEAIDSRAMREASTRAAVEPAPGAPAPATPVPAAPAPGVPSPAVDPLQPAPQQPAGAPAAPAGPGASLRFAAPEARVAPGQTLTMQVVVDGAQQLFATPLRIRYDQRVLKLTDVTRGDFLAGPEATDLIFSRNIRDQVGQAAVNLSRFPGTGGADGSGVLVTLTFEGVAAGQSTVSVTPTGARDASQQPVNLPGATATVSVGQ